MQLNDSLENNFRLTDGQKKALKRLGLFSVRDLLFYFPARYTDISAVKNIAELIPGELATVYGRVSKLKTKKGFRSKIPMAEGEIEDLSGKIKITWFNQAYLAKMLHDGEEVKMTGNVTKGKYGVYLANPEFERISANLNDKDIFEKKNLEGASYPIYRETKGITSKWIYHSIAKILGSEAFEEIEEYIPEEILKKYSLPTLRTSLIWIHQPKKEKDAEAARKRFAFEEVFAIQLERQHDKAEYQNSKGYKIEISKDDLEEFISRFPFTPTKAQSQSIKTILEDFKKPYPMSRLLEGDVGSGKTAVAAVAAYSAVRSGLQVAYMAPTEILATQHFESFIKYFNPEGVFPVNVGLLTGKSCRKFPSKVNPDGWTDISRSQLLKWVNDGTIPILIGTHTLIQKSVKFKNLSLAIIDEQHRFGTNQRKKFVNKDGAIPHLLSMTATPIPRTLALTIYGDLDLSLLDEMPKGRKPIITEIVKEEDREKTYEEIRKELETGRQLYVICPRIDAEEDGSGLRSRGSRADSLIGEGRSDKKQTKSSSLELKSVKQEAKRLKNEIFPEYEIDILHSKMNKDKKEEVMEDFKNHNIDILVATSVVEVGVNVPNATIIIIEGGERFGLAQLHQLRGRVIRSNHQAYCYVFADSRNEKTTERLEALRTAKSGFELAELDLNLRGSGELSGVKQSGLTDLGMEAIKNIKMVEFAREEATKLIAEDRELKNYPKLKELVKEKAGEFHFE